MGVCILIEVSFYNHTVTYKYDSALSILLFFICFFFIETFWRFVIFGVFKWTLPSSLGIVSQSVLGSGARFILFLLVIYHQYFTYIHSSSLL